MPHESEFPLVMRALNEHGLLLKQDKRLANVVSLVTGEALSASWWGHPKAHAIFRCLTELADHADVLVTKLAAGKDTFVHRRLWPAALAVASAGEPWQLNGLSPEARTLLEQVASQGKSIATGESAKELERRLLLHGEQVHTESGAHKNCLETWDTWARRVGCETDLSVAEGQSQLEDAVRAIGGTGEELPWHRLPRKRR